MQKKNRLGIIVILAFMVSFFPAFHADAATTHDIGSSNVTCDGGTHTITGSTTKYHVTIKGKNPEVTISGVTIDMTNEKDDDDSIEAAAICVKEGCNATLIVKGTNWLRGGNHTGIGKNTGYAGIHIEDGATLTIKGESGAKLTVYGGGDYSGAERGGAAIGSNSDDDMGDLTIEGNLTIEAHGAIQAAGIGSGYDAVAGNITIKGGNITTTGGKYGAGIGGGNAVGSGKGGNAKNITISGGTIHATGGEGAAGIGGSDEGDIEGTLAISAGNITAIGGSEGAGIGGGKEGYTPAIEITGGTITATGGKWAAGIGGGNAVGLTGDGGHVGSLTITGGTITAAGGGSEGTGGAGIGGSDGGEVGSLRIEEKSANSLQIDAQGGKWGAGIGSAAEGVPSPNISSIYIKLNGGTIQARGGEQGAGIGGGNTSADKIEIYGKGTIHATGVEQSCAIGAGECEDGGIIIIEGSYGAPSYADIDDGSNRALQITAATEGTSGAAIIGAADSGGKDIYIKNAAVTLVDNTTGNKWSAMIGNANNHSMLQKDMGSITIENCKITDTADATTRWGATIGAGNDSEVDNITIKMTSFNGGTIGGTNNSNDVFKETSIDSITIENSKITAKNYGTQMKAAIGSGCFAAVDSITITNSEIDAYTNSGAGIGSGGYHYTQSGDPLKWNGCACGDITITKSKIIAAGGDGGAGIGGGWGTSAGDITIQNSEISARALNATDGAAGIGGGHSESCGNIKIKESKVTAEGGSYSAGIGSSGFTTIYTTLWDTTCHSIWITDSTITSTGGNGAAGIGTGYGAQFDSDAVIFIDSSSVTAAGGSGGAGIGAGADGALGSGGQMSATIYLCGYSQIKATGGECGAGIGGGLDGGADKIVIDLAATTYDKTQYNADKDEYGDWKYYVKAYGGSGAAGIGGGGVHEDDDDVFKPYGYDLEELIIRGGYVYAVGGNDIYNNGAGAGIGGGAHGGNLNDLEVYGGYIVADGGTGGGAKDIGYGGNDIEPLRKDGDASIYGGTVIGNFSDELDLIIDGGSVRYNSDEVENADGTNVYRTTAQTGAQYVELLNAAISSDYGTTDIFSDEFGKVYLYLPESATDQATLDCKIDNENRHYYGTTTTDGDGWIKMDGSLQLSGPDSEPVVGVPFAVTVAGDPLPDGTTVNFSVTGEHITIENAGTNNTMPGAQVQLLASDWAEYTVTASTADNYSNEMYWGATGTYTGKVTKKQGTIQITEDISKVYDGDPVNAPAVTIDSDVDITKVTYKYYKDGADLGENAPVNAGDYTVVASIPATDNYGAAQSTPAAFTISKRPVAITLTASESGTDATITTALSGYVTDSGLGKIEFTIDGGSSQEAVVNKNGSNYTASKTFNNVNAATYTVTAALVDADNYEGIPTTKEFTKGYGERTITIDPKYPKTYGDADLNLADEITLTDAGGNPLSLGSNEAYSYELVNITNQRNLEQAIRIDASGNIEIVNAGLAVVKITLPSNDIYNEATAYTRIVVKRATLEVTPYAYEKNDTTKQKVTKITYGSLDTLAYDLKYSGLVNGDTKDDFTNGHGTLVASSLNETSGVGTYSLNIDKIPAAGTNYFISRNYKIQIAESKITVDPATLYITADDKTSNYGIEPEYTYTFGNKTGNYTLMAWDRPEDIVDAVGLKGTKPYTSYAPGSYEDVIKVTTKDTVSNYVFGTNSSTLLAGTLTVKKGNLQVDASVPSKTYDGKAATLTITIDPVLSDGITKDQLKPCDDKEIIYYQIAKDGTKKRLSAAPVNAGDYSASIIVAKDNTYYNQTTTTVNFSIYKARLNIETPKVPDIEMRTGLTLSAQVLPDGWTWVVPDRALSVGSVSAYAVYTPSDTTNYYREIRAIQFNVYEKDTDSGDGDDSSTPGDDDGTFTPGDDDGTFTPGGDGDSSTPENTPGSDSGSGTGNGSETGSGSETSTSTSSQKSVKSVQSGDNSNILLWSILAIAMLGLIIIVFRTYKKH